MRWRGETKQLPVSERPYLPLFLSLFPMQVLSLELTLRPLIKPLQKKVTKKQSMVYLGT